MAKETDPYLQLYNPFVSLGIPEWKLLEQVDDCEQLSVFLSSDVWAQFAQTQSYIQFKAQHPARDVDLQK